MPHVARNDFSLGWQPDADAVNAPPNALLRADNLILDELGVVALRKGSAKLNAVPLADVDIHSLFTAVLAGNRYRMAGAGNSVYANGTAISTGLAGSNDVAFGEQLGQILYARSTSKQKYDGSTVRNWGIGMTGNTVSVVGIASDSKTFATGALAEAPAFTTVEDDGTGPTYDTNHAGVANGAIVFHPATTNRAIYQKTFLTPQDFTVYDAGQIGVDDDIISWYLYLPDPTLLVNFSFQVDVNDGTFQQDWYQTPLFDGTLPSQQQMGTPFAPLVANFGVVGAARDQVRSTIINERAGDDTNDPTPAIGTSGAAAGWTKVRFRRGDMIRLGDSNGKGWSTVKAVRIYAQMSQSGATTECRVDTVQISGGAQRTLLGQSAWRYVYVRNDGYLAKSAPSPVSPNVVLNAQGAAVTIPADASRDGQVNEIWLFRMDQKLDNFYRVAVKTAVSGTGPYTINDLVSSEDALIANIPIEVDNVVPPDNIIGIAGPHYSRTFVLTSDGQVWPSRRLNPDSYGTSQTVTVCGNDEIPYWIIRAGETLLIGTSKDVYRLDGTGAELPDGSVDFTLRGMNVDHRPVTQAIAHEGGQVVFFSDDGWRALGGAGGTESIIGTTSQLYQGKARHDVEPVNVESGRFRAALWKGQFVAVTPEVPDTTSSHVLYRRVFAKGLWYRHTYTWAEKFRSIYRENDGTLLAGDSGGTVWQLDTTTLDDGNNIEVVCWTKADDLGLPYQRKKAGDLRWRADTGGAAANMTVHIDGQSTAAMAITTAMTGMDVTPFDLTTLQIFKQVQLRLSARLAAFRLYDYGYQFRERPIPIIGRVVDVLGGSPGIKILSGYVIKCNTFGATRIITPYLDGVADAETFSLTTSAEEPETHTLRFTLAGRRASDIGFFVNGEIEIDSWSPIVTQRQPLGVKVWDSGPIDLGDKDLVWLREMLLKVRAGADLTITPYFDGVAFPTVTGFVTPDVDTIISVPVGRSYVGRQPRLVVTSCEPFYPYFVRCIRRTTGKASQKPAVTVAFELETGGA